MKHTFNFSIRQAIRESWNTFTKHPGFFVGVTLVTLLLNISGGKNTPWVITFILVVASFVWSIVWLKLSLAGARNDESKLNLAALRNLLPMWKEAVSIIGIGLLCGLLVLGGFIMLIIPGIYIAIRLSVSNLAYLDRKESIQKSVRYSWNITKGKFREVFLVGLAIIALYLVGIIALGIGLFVAYPIASILRARLYFALSEDYNKQEGVALQPVEIPADLSEVEIEKTP